jgi:LacI family transcriptional regulator
MTIAEGSRPGVKQVAKAAGVSITTVSNVLNGRGRMSAETIDRVRAAMAELGYVRNEAARQLRAGQSRHVGIVVLDLSNPFFVDMIRGAERRAREDELYVLIGNSDRDPQLERSHITIFTEQRARGLLLSPAGDPSDLLDRLKGITPTVVLDYLPPEGTFSSVSVDDVAGGYLAVKHLLDGGRRHIAVVAGSMELRQIQDRLRGAREAVAEHPEASLEVVHTTALTVAAGRTAGASLRSRSSNSRVDAIFAVNDLLATGVLLALREDASLRVPDDIAIIGYDDIAIAADAPVPLSSVRQPTELMGYSALDMLLRTERTGEIETLVFQPELVIRRSSSMSGSGVARS